METLLPPKPGSLVFEDERVWACLATFPRTPGHTIVAWRKDVADLHLLSGEEYEYLMDVVDVARNALQSCLHVEKVYLMYMDEIKHVHWHLIPRYGDEGLDILQHAPKETDDFSLAEPLREYFKNASNLFK